MLIKRNEWRIADKLFPFHKERVCLWFSKGHKHALLEEILNEEFPMLIAYFGLRETMYPQVLWENK